MGRAGVAGRLHSRLTAGGKFYMAIIGVIKGGRCDDELPATDGSMTDLLDYEIFTRVIKAGSLSAAARELHGPPVA
jgi:hypothetical protein